VTGAIEFGAGVVAGLGEQLAAVGVAGR